MSQVVFFRVEATGVADLVDQLGLARREAQDLQRQMRAAADPAEYTRLNRELENNRRQQSAITTQIRETERAAVRSATAVSGSYTDLNNQLVELRRNYRQLTAEERASAFGEQTIMQIQRLDQELRQIDASMGQFQRNVGNYPGGNRGIAAFGQLIQQTGGPLGNFVGQVEGLAGPISTMASSLGLAGTAGLAAGAAIAGVGVVAAAGVAKAMEYETAFAQLSATLGVSGDEADALKQRISELQTITLDNGSSIVSTSTQIADALTVVGSAAPQLLKNQDALQAVTKEVIVFSKSAGTDMAESARIVTGAMNLFGLESSEAARVINVLAAGEKEGSATTLEAAEALEKAGGAANLAGVSIEETTAAIQLLAKDSIKGSEAGTALRNVLLKLSTTEALPKEAQEAFAKTGKELSFFSDKTVPLVDKLQALKGISQDTAAMTKIFGTENINAAISLTKYADEFPNLTAAITKTDTAYDQAGVKQDTFAAKLENISNKVSNLLTSLGGLLLPILSEMADFAMAGMEAVSELGDAFVSVGEAIGDAVGNADWFSQALKGLKDAIIFVSTLGFKILRYNVLGVGATFVGLKAVIENLPQTIKNMIENAVTNLMIFTLKAKGMFKDASNFISLGFASGGEEYYKQADALYNDLQKRTADQKGLFEQFGDAFVGFLTEAENKDKARKVAADQAVKAEEEALLLAEKLKADAEAKKKAEEEAAAAAKKRAEEAKKAAEKAANEAKKRAEEERRNLNFLREELAKVEEQISKYTDKNLIPTALLQSYNSLKNEIASVEKQLNDLFKAQQKPVVPVFVELQGQNDFLNEFNKLNDQIQAEATKATNASIMESIRARQEEQYAADVEKFKNAEDMKGQIREQLIKAAFDLTQQASDEIFKLEEENAERRLDKQMEMLDRQETEQLALVEGNAIAEQQVREDFAAQREQLEREAFEKKKQMDIAQAIMNAALAITQVFASSPPPLSFVLAGITAAQTAIQIATIAAQEFAQGGLIDPFGVPKAEHGIFTGPSHAGGGINTRLSGRRVNVEGGEFYERLANGSSVVINKRSTSRFRNALLSQAGKNYPNKLQTLSAINQYGGGVPLFAMGGLVAPMGNASVDPNQNVQLQLLAAAVDKLSNRVPVLTVQSYDTVNARANQVKTLQGL